MWIDTPVTLELFQRVLDAINAAVLVMDADGRVLFANRSAAEEFGISSDHAVAARTGEMFKCSHNEDSDKGCGFGPYCMRQCVLRSVARKAIQGEESTRVGHKLTVKWDLENRDFFLLLSASPIQYESQTVALVTMEDVTELERLRGFIPICAGCKKIRNDEDYWEHVESYIAAHSGARFTHGFCPDCIGKLYGDDMVRRKAAS